MNSIKNAIVSITLLVVGYGSYVILQEPAPGPFTELGIENAATVNANATRQTPSSFIQQPTLAPQAGGSLAANRFAPPQQNPGSILQKSQFGQGEVANLLPPNTDLKAKTEALADAVASRFESFDSKPASNHSGSSFRSDPPKSNDPTPLGAELSLPKVELENAAAGVTSSLASAFTKAKETVTQQVEQSLGDKVNVTKTIDQTLDKAQNAFANQVENVKATASGFAKSASDLGSATRKELETKLPALPKLIDAPSELKLPALKTNLANSTAAEATPESLNFESPKSEFRKLTPKEVAPEKTENELTISNIESTIPPPFANRTDAVSPFDRSVRVDSSQDTMPTLPRVDEWEPYVGPPLSAADLEAGRTEEFFNEDTKTATNSSLEVVEAGLVLPADTTTPTAGEKFEPFAEPINPPVAAQSQQAKDLVASAVANNTANLASNPGGKVPTKDKTNSPPSSFEETPRYPNTADVKSTQTQPVSFNQQGQSPAQGQAELATKPNATFEKIWVEVQGYLKKRDYPRALRALTPWSSESDLNKEQASRCILLLDQLAGAIIYSRQSYLEPEYQVKAGETLEEIAAQYGVPQALISKINGIAPPYALMTGEKLKVVRGPFRATISLSRRELTLYVGPNYAGRFPVLIGSDLPPESAFYEVAEKLEGRTYFDRRLGREIIRSEASNRYGKHWLGLRGEHITTGHSVGIHGRPDESSNNDVGSLSLEAKDAADVFSILSVGSRVEVRP